MIAGDEIGPGRKLGLTFKVREVLVGLYADFLREIGRRLTVSRD